MKKQIFALLMIAALLVGMFTACGNKETDTTTEDDTVYTITLAHDFTGAAAETLSTYITKFSEDFSSIQVEIMAASDITEDNTPDILICQSGQIAELVADKQLLALDSLVDSDTIVLRGDGNAESMGLSDEQKEDILDIFYDEGKIDGELYALPIAKSEQVLYFNQTLFDENDLRTPMTWEAMEEACIAIKELDPESIPLCVEDPADFFISICAQYGGEFASKNGKILFNSEENREVMKRLNQWYQKGYITTSTLMGRSSPGAINAQDTRHYIALGSSKDATAQQPTQTGDSFSFELAVYPFPQQSYETRQSLTRSTSICMYKNDDDDLITRAWLLLRYLVTDIEFQSRFAVAAGLMPAMESAIMEEQFSKFINKANGADNVPSLAALACMEQDTAVFVIPVFDGAATAYEQIGTLLDHCLTLTGDNVDAQIEAAFNAAEKACK